MTGEPLTASEPGPQVVARHTSAPGPGLGSEEDFDFEIEITVRGIEHTQVTTYGDRRGRETLATLRVAVTDRVAWEIFQSATGAVIAPVPLGYESGFPKDSQR